MDRCGTERKRSRPTSRNWPSGHAFTLIELLVATVALVILVTVTASIFMDSESIRSSVTDKMENDRSGRAALGMLTHDLEGAVADSNLTWALGPDRNLCTSYGHANDEMCFVSFQNDSADTARTARAIYYWTHEMDGPGGSNRYALFRGCYAITNAVNTNAVDNCYWNINWYEEPIRGGIGRPQEFGVIAENISAFRVIPALSGGTHTGLQEYVDVVLEVLPGHVAKQVAEILARSDVIPTNLVEQNVKRYATRVFLQNRQGYRER